MKEDKSCSVSSVRGVWEKSRLSTLGMEVMNLYSYWVFRSFHPGFSQLRDLLCVLQPVINLWASVYSWVNRATVALLAEVRRAGLGLCKHFVWSRKWGGRQRTQKAGRSRAEEEVCGVDKELGLWASVLGSSRPLVSTGKQLFSPAP